MLLLLQVTASRGSAVNVLQVLFSFCLDVLVLGGKFDTSSLSGAALIVLGVLMSSGTLSDSEDRAPSSSQSADGEETGREVERDSLK